MSAKFFGKLKRVNKKSNLIVYGYLRQCETTIFGELSKSNTYYNFPEIMLNICLIYYHIMDKWDKKYIGETHKLSNDELSIEVSANGFFSSFGTETASPPGKYVWKFKLNAIPTSFGDEHNEYWGIILGVWKINSGPSPLVSTYWTDCGSGGTWKYGYAYDITAGTLVDCTGSNAATGGEYGKKCSAGDMVEMCLDFDTSTLKLIINGKDMGVSHQDIEDTEYKLALCTYDSGSIIEIVP